MGKSTLERYGLIGVGLMVAIGFGAPAISIVMQNQQIGQGSQDNQEINATLPNTTFSSESYGLSVKEQAYLSVNEQKVFVNALYEDNSSAFNGLESLASDFEDRVYINMINKTDSPFAAGYNISTPSALVIGDQPGVSRGRRVPYSLGTSEPDKESIKEGICSAMKEPGEFAATCFS